MRSPRARASSRRDGSSRCIAPGSTVDLPEIPALPDGIEVRPVEESQYRAIWRADIEAFRDHWGGGDESDEAFRRYQDAPSFDPSLWVVAWDGDEVVAASVNTIYHEDNKALAVKRGWLDSIFTRRPWRKRGLASALIVRSLHVACRSRHRDRGARRRRRQPSGALRLYESHGFSVVERASAWRKSMEEVPT